MGAGEREVQPVLTPEERQLLEKDIITLNTREVFARQKLIRRISERGGEIPPSKPIPIVDPCWHGVTMASTKHGLALVVPGEGHVPLGEQIEAQLRELIPGDPCELGYLADIRMRDRTILELIGIYPDGQRQPVWRKR